MGKELAGDLIRDQDERRGQDSQLGMQVSPMYDIRDTLLTVCVTCGFKSTGIGIVSSGIFRFIDQLKRTDNSCATHSELLSCFERARMRRIR